MRLRQGQVWKHGEALIRIVRLQRLAVEYMTIENLKDKKGPHHHASKKEFCRVLKHGRPVSLPPSATGVPTPPGG
jgi:hypothetical protein